MTPSDTDVTVVVVTYNHAAYVQQTLTSIANQTRKPVRVVVIDDASPDGCADVIEQWQIATGFELELIRHTRNTGLCRGLNEALATITTPLYTYISGDDVMRSDRLEKQVARWTTQGRSAVAVYANARRIDAHGAELLPDWKVAHAWPSVLEGTIHTELLRRDWIPAASVLLSTQAVRSAGGYDERWFFEDYDLWLRLAARGTFLVVDEPLVDFRELESSLGSTRFTESDPDFLAARVGIWTKQVGESAEGDAWLRMALPPLAIRLWQTGRHPDIARQAFQAFPQLNMRLRSLLMRLGITRQPAVFTSASNAMAGIRHRVRALYRRR